MAEGESRWTFAARLLPESHGSQIELLNLPRFNPTPVSKGLHMSAEKSSDSSDLPVTLTIELGRLNLSVAKLADLKPGDVLNLNRSVSEPVEITSGERLVARGELVQIEEQIGVRILQVLL
jgi:type III secretion system YscQ/HrcQ family protein